MLVCIDHALLRSHGLLRSLNEGSERQGSAAVTVAATATTTRLTTTKETVKKTLFYVSILSRTAFVSVCDAEYETVVNASIGAGHREYSVFE